MNNTLCVGIDSLCYKIGRNVEFHRWETVKQNFLGEQWIMIYPEQFIYDLAVCTEYCIHGNIGLTSTCLLELVLWCSIYTVGQKKGGPDTLFLLNFKNNYHKLSVTTNKIFYRSYKSYILSFEKILLILTV